MAADVLGHAWMERVLTQKTGKDNSLFAIHYTVHLYVNDFTPDCFSSPGSFVECTLAGYAAIDLISTNFLLTPYPLSGSCGWIASYPPVSFTFGASGQTVYGLWVEDSYGDMAWAKRLDVPYVVPGGGGSLQIQPNMVEQQCT